MPRLGPSKLISYLPRPTPDQLLQREIEDTLMLISSLPETNDKVMIDLGSGVGPGGFEIQRNQLELFLRLEGLVERLSPEKKTGIVEGLHPAMSVKERVALKAVLERGLRKELVPRALDVRKKERVDEGRGVEEEGRRPSVETLPQPLSPLPALANSEKLLFPELTDGELAIRRRELDAERNKQAGIFDPATSSGDGSADISTPESRKRRQEIANLFAQATKKLQDASAAGPSESVATHSPLHMLRSATSALRAYTDASPREVLVMARAADAGRSSQETGWSGRASAQSERRSASIYSRPSQTTLRTSDGEPGPSQTVERNGESAPVVLEAAPRPSAVSAASNPPKPGDREQKAQLLRSKISRPIIQQDPLTPFIDQFNNTPPPIIPGGRIRPSTCPWPETFWSSPRAAPTPPPPPRSASLPQQQQLQPLPQHPSPSPEEPPTPPPKEAQSPSSSSSPNTQAEPAGGEKRAPPGSVSAARAGLAERMRREQIETMRRNLPFTRVEEAWSGIGSPRSAGEGSSSSSSPPSASGDGSFEEAADGFQSLAETGREG